MYQQRLFTEPGFLTGSWVDAFMGAVALTMLVLVSFLYRSWSRGRRGTELARPAPGKLYQPHLAWLRAAVYFCACLLISWASGVFNTLAAGNWALFTWLGDSHWLGAVIAILGLEYLLYYRLWAAGTTFLNRRRYPLASSLFGLLWGVAEGLLFLSFWAFAEKTGLPLLWVALITWLAIGAFYGPWHRFYWDFYVAPQHNITAWNTRKVIFVHNPNMLLTLAYLVVFQEPIMFIVFTVFCLLGACHAMRFPSPFDRISQRPIVDTYLEGSPEISNRG